jgi:hypothetical protein
MAEKHSIRDKVIAGLIIAAILGAVSYVSPWRAQALQLLGSMARWFLRPIAFSIPTWVLILLALAVLLVAIRWMRNVVQRVRAPRWSAYTKDSFHGVTWRWDWSPDGSLVQNLWCFCTKDETTLVAGTTTGIDTLLRCETCDKRTGPFSGDSDDLRNSIKRQIDRKLRTGEWKTARTGA